MVSLKKDLEKGQVSRWSGPSVKLYLVDSVMLKVFVEDQDVS